MSPKTSLKSFITEYIEHMTIEEAAQIINDRCKEWRKFAGSLTEFGNNNIIYRGMRVMYAPDVVIKYPRTSRRPLTTGQDDHEMADEYFKEKFGVPFRSSGIFVSRSKELASYYGDVYAIFPLDRVTFAWSEQVEDFTNTIREERVKLLGSTHINSEIDEEAFFKIMDSLHYEHDNDSLRQRYFKYRDLKKHELMIHCDEYLAVREEVLDKVLNLLD